MNKKRLFSQNAEKHYVVGTTSTVTIDHLFNLHIKRHGYDKSLIPFKLIYVYIIIKINFSNIIHAYSHTGNRLVLVS